MREVQKRAEDPSYECTDPLTGEKVKLPQNTEGELFHEHFSAWERRMIAEAADVVGRLKSWVTFQLVIYVLFMVLAFVMMAWLNNDAIRTMGILFLTIMIASIVWTIFRLRILRNPPQEMAAIELSSPLAS